MVKPFLLLSCEHAGNQIPAAYRKLFLGCHSILQSHQGWDLHAWRFAKHLQKRFDCPLHGQTVSRLLIDCNRSLHHPAVWSPWSCLFAEEQKKEIVERYYLPHRHAIEQRIAGYLVKTQGSRARLQKQAKSCVLHLAVHSFTGFFNERWRSTEVGLLYDPHRQAEKKLVLAWKKVLKKHWQDPLLSKPLFAVHCNRPYRGQSDGLTTFFRQRWPDTAYIGLELELNQHLLGQKTYYESLLGGIVESLRGILQRKELFSLGNVNT